MRTILTWWVVLVVVSPLNVARAQLATEATLVEDTISNFPYYENPDRRREQLNNARQDLNELTQPSPHEQWTASFVFGAGQTTDNLIAFVAAHGLTVVEVLVKQPESERGTVRSTIIGLDWLLATDGDFGRRLRCAIGIRRATMERRRQGYLRSPMDEMREQALQLERMLAETPKIYRMNAFGTASSLASAASDTVVAAVTPPGKAQWVQTYELMTTDPGYKAAPAIAYVGTPANVPISCSGSQ